MSALLLAFAAPGSALADPSADGKPKAKASSFAPHHTRRHAYGAPVSKPILHKRKKSKQPAGASQPIK